ncbi:hypothetical protein [Streptomyces sp. NPDC001165]|uniref:hypothetical protein n=1 Tax=Streptomyces sp. NPDC001165 TaxID=3364546 RepID=UPI00369BFE8F
MDVVAIWSVSASTLVGSLGILVPAMTKRGDRKHDSDLEQQRAEIARANWVREKRASAYERLLKAIDEHLALNDEPRYTKFFEYEIKHSEALGTSASAPPPEEGKVSSDEMHDWRQRRSDLLMAAYLAARMWSSNNMQLAWGRLQEAASRHDDAEVRNTGIPPATSLETLMPLNKARLELQVQAAYDLQGPGLYLETPKAVTFSPSDPEEVGAR